MLDHLAQSLREHMGREITPEIAARLYASVQHVPGQDEWITRRVLIAGSDGWFYAASKALGATYSRASGHQLVVQMDAQGEGMAFAILTDIRPGAAAELTAWVRGDHGGAGRDFLRVLGELAFERLKLHTMIAFVAENNSSSLTCCVSLGFSKTARVPGYFGDQDGFLMVSNSRRYRWHRGNA